LYPDIEYVFICFSIKHYEINALIKKKKIFSSYTV
jgi:hypothetical protein